MRFFIALEIPEESKKELWEVQNNLQQIVPGVRLTKNDKLHLTLTFIGEQPESFTKRLIEIIKKSVVGVTPFAVSPAYIDGFPRLHFAHTFFVGVKGEIDRLMIIRERLKDSLGSIGLGIDERRYVPHIAIGKIDNFHLKKDQEQKLQEVMLKKEFSSIQITSIKLFESIPEEGFHKHNTLAEVKLF